MLTWALSVLVSVNCCGEALGTWTMIAAKSRAGAGPFAGAIAVKYEARRKDAQTPAETWTFYQVRSDGTSETTSQTLRFDGREYPCGDLGLEERPDTVVSTRSDSRTAEVSYKKSGRVTRRVVRTVSPDGRQLTLEIWITPAKGSAVARRMVFVR
jgi:hypothetical protein